MTRITLFLVPLSVVLGIAHTLPSQTEHATTELSKASNQTTSRNGTSKANEDEGWEFENTTVVDTRRILYSKDVQVGNRPYMVYLQLTKESAKAHKYRGWLCGGVIVDQYYVLTSAACVEDADRFYIVSGTTKYVDSFDYKKNDCVCKNRRRVVWKCIPKNYKFDFQDSIKWSSNDIAIVKVDKPFKFGVMEKGCEFATDLICYNNISRELEKAGTKGWIAGWGSMNTFREGVYRRQDVHIPENSKCLQEAKVCIMDNESCAKKWAQKFRNIITQYMICTKDVMKRLSEICDKKYANCTDVDTRRAEADDWNDAAADTLNVDLGRHLKDPDDYTARRSSLQGGFCENDHGGPLIVKYQGKERVIGVISACKIDPKSHSCHGPFLYTSVFKNRQFLSCAINKDVENNCRRVFRSGITHEEWTVSWDGVNDDEDKLSEHKDDGDNSDRSDIDELRSGKIKSQKQNKNTDAANDSDEEPADKKARAGKTKEDASVKPKKNKTKSSKRNKKTKKSKDKSDGKGKKEVMYESTKEDNVNNPDDE
ncbi:uncharacterized protein LOC101743340 [Bombyx mori]|uniref:uncharacterized protein LOC101743340 n=1 Tax=Bombyx mori TaxID=7091 RepID=UPI002ED4C1BD